MNIRDKREKNWFYVDNEYLNGYARILGGNCTLTYLSLCRHAREDDQTCFPQMRTIAYENGISVKSVERALKTLQEWGIIEVEKRKDPDTKRQMSNVYTLLSKSVWREKPTDKNPTDSQSVGKADRQNEPEPTDKSRPTPVLHNNTKYNNTQEQYYCNPQEIAEVIKHFATFIDPKNKLYYANTTQRGAADFLITEYGFEKVLSAIEAIPKLKKVSSYFPSITTPVELRDKWKKIEDSLIREQLKKTSRVVN